MYKKDFESKIHDVDFFLKLLDSSTTKKKISFVNPFSYAVLCENSHIIDEIDYWFSDGSLLTTLMNVFDKDKVVNRVSFDFSSIADDFFKEAVNKKWRLAIIGAKSDEIDIAVNYISDIYPDLDICYYRDGYFDINDEKVYHNLEKLKVDTLLVGMGTPYQEKFIIEACKTINLSLAITCGGFITQTAMKGDYYHPLVKKLGLRWLQRAVLHKHVRQRILCDYPIFLAKYILSRLLDKTNRYLNS
ncbi:WecB/TagA/CpsF family glycosyltransferase [Vibrio anguillarum]|uniref:WecB/TagA/CpsF family glycosyltransferase n=1 Tax=Vibrio anguillarum TaxID=55601 RepID=A0ABD4QUA7_VIBAN|nr:WecB/TagA/CpsF family glycosyltransferase [Vibrio anguillarum]MBT2918461.1 WecB/TagA/CpsF family glycosyltransferase [Vibrio anguillarum]